MIPYLKPTRKGFSLIELLVAIAALTLLVLLLVSLAGGVNRAWVAGEQQVSEFQDGRAILELISRELSQAVISPTLQFVQNPTLPAGFPIRAYSDQIFWMAPATSTASGNLSEIGYYLAEDRSNPALTGAEIYQLRRFCVPPSDVANYQIFTSPNQPTDYSAPWVSSFLGTAVLSTPVASGVIAFWVRCFDTNGDLIPWLSANATGVGPMKFNSRAHFQPAIPGIASSFKYTNAVSTVTADLLPTSVELTIVTLDPKTFQRNPSIPAQIGQATPDDLFNPPGAGVATSFLQQLVSNNIKSAHLFTTRVRLANGVR